MDRLPFVTPVYQRDLRIEDYYIGYLQHPYLSLYTGRGCRSRCTFCLWPQTVGGHRYRTRSVESVLEEAALARELFPQMKELFFDDDTFTDDRGRAEAIARGLARLGITWSCNAKANVPRETLMVLRDNGLRLLLVGYESGNQQILINIKKGLRVDRARQFAADCRDLGITVHGTFILGLPGETKETIQETIRFAREVNPHSLQVSVAAPYPGTELYRQAVEQGLAARRRRRGRPGQRGRLPAGRAVLPAPGAHRDPGLGGRVLPAVLLPRREAGGDVRRDVPPAGDGRPPDARGRGVRALLEPARPHPGSAVSGACTLLAHGGHLPPMPPGSYDGRPA